MFIDSTPPTYSIMNRLHLGFMNVLEFVRSKPAGRWKIVGILALERIKAMSKLDSFRGCYWENQSEKFHPESGSTKDSVCRKKCTQ